MELPGVYKWGAGGRAAAVTCEPGARAKECYAGWKRQQVQRTRACMSGGQWQWVVAIDRRPGQEEGGTGRHWHALADWLAERAAAIIRESGREITGVVAQFPGAPHTLFACWPASSPEIAVKVPRLTIATRVRAWQRADCSLGRDSTRTRVGSSMPRRTTRIPRVVDAAAVRLPIIAAAAISISARRGHRDGLLASINHRQMTAHLYASYTHSKDLLDVRRK